MLKISFSLFVICILCLALCQGRKSGSRFTNIKCESYDESFLKVKKCQLNLLGRGVVGIDIFLSLFKVPIDNVTINFSLWRRLSGFRPFLYNSTVDLCYELAHAKKISFIRLVLNAIQTASNLNHTCPYDHDIIVDNLVWSDDFLVSLPVPKGVYKFQLRFAVKSVWKLQVDAFVEQNIDD